MKHIPLAFIGAGNMASAIIGGLVEQGYPGDKICASDPVAENLKKLSAQFGINTTEDNNDAVKQAQMVVLAIKPQVMGEVCQPLKSSVQAHRPLIVSIAAGISVASLGSWLGTDSAIVRCMPNTPALVQTGATALYANTHVSQEQQQWVDQLMGTIGICEWIETESLLDAVTALSGSGPAYFFYAMEAMIDAGEKLGLDREVATKLTLQTALGAAKMACSSDVDPAELRHRVSSPGGTTVAALQVFQNRGFKDLFYDALAAAERRSQELAKELGA